MRRAGILLALALALLAGGVGSGVAAPAVDAAGRRLMVTLAPAPPSIWNRTTVELAATYQLRTVFSWSLASIGERCIVFEILRRSRKPAELAERLSRDPRVRSVEPIQTFETLGLAAEAPLRGDPYSRLQRSAQAIGVDRAHRWATGRGVKVAVIDTGIDLDHPDLRGRIVKANNFVDRGEPSFTSDIHGTAVAGVLAAVAGNDVGIAGTAPEAEIFALKACWPEPPGSRRALCDSYTLAKAIDFAIVEHAQILNFSLGGPPDPLLGRLIRAALDRGIVVVAAAGNSAAGEASPAVFPAELDGVLAVQETDLEGRLRSAPALRRALFAAPGVDILTTVPHASYDFFTGSSLAAAEVSGVAALLLERVPKLTPAELAALLRRTAHPLAAPTEAEAPIAVALIDACAALRAVVAGVTCP